MLFYFTNRHLSHRAVQKLVAAGRRERNGQSGIRLFEVYNLQNP
jgi:hypothetical protein